jgi:hypothetical protein
MNVQAELLYRPILLLLILDISASCLLSNFNVMMIRFSVVFSVWVQNLGKRSSEVPVAGNTGYCCVNVCLSNTKEFRERRDEIIKTTVL